MKNILAFRLTRHVLSAAMGVGMLAVLIMGNAGMALADGTPTPTPVATGSTGTNFTVSPGSLSASSTINFYSDAGLSTPVPSVTLNGRDQTVYLKMPVTVTNAQGTDGGWTLDLYATRFTSTYGGTDHELTNMPHITSLSSSSGLTHQDTSSFLQPNSYTDGIQATSGEDVPSTSSNTQIHLLEAASGTYTDNGVSHGYGMGSYTLTVPMSLTIAAQDYAQVANDGTQYPYGSTFTFDIDPAV